MTINGQNLVYTIRDRCRVCYTCVRECPVKAIKIVNGQAEIIPERCIACGNCTQVCSQGAKVFLDSTDRVVKLLESGEPVYALLAPSFVAEFNEYSDYKSVIGLLRKLGFSKVYEVAFGADLISKEYRLLMTRRMERGIISSDCPAIVSYIEKYQPELIKQLAPVVSPMVAMARYLRMVDKGRFHIVFIGPCIAKKAESHEITEKITFRELRKLLKIKDIRVDSEVPGGFDLPVAGRGTLFPISRGLLQTIRISEDEMEGHVIVAEGKECFKDAVQEYVNGSITTEHLELQCCEGCIMGPGMIRNGKKFSRRASVLSYMARKNESFDLRSWLDAISEGERLDLSRSFRNDDQRTFDPSEKQIQEVLGSLNKFSEEDNLDCGACGYNTCRNHAIAIINGLAEHEMCLPNSIEKLHKSVSDLAVSNEKLYNVQQTLRQTEKLAHMGQLSAGIAHELNNPLGVVIMYTNILLDEAEQGSQLENELKLIVEQAQRCKSIVGGLLNFARKNQVNRSEVNLEDLVQDSLSSVVIPSNVSVQIESNLQDPIAELDKEQMIQVISNLVKNGTEAMQSGGIIRIGLEDYKPEITIRISDNGSGISEDDLQKVFEPFFTTKGIGKGTGLGLATAYGVIKMHKGNINVTSNTDPLKGPTGSCFTITIPRRSFN